jgi:hypothetical protein
MAIINVNIDFEVAQNVYLIWLNEPVLAQVDRIVITRTPNPITNDVKYFVKIGPALINKAFNGNELFATLQDLKDSC